MAKLKTKKSKMTLDRLALITQQGFLDVDKKFESIDKRFDLVDKRFDKIESEIKEMKESSSELFTRLDKFIALYEKQEQEMLLFGAQLRRLEERIIKLEAKK
ncbi:hypothetical protein HZB04_01930 [Candidatus Wolfebacteria bacterium]|nr:hypothetical protein [Candidatus Wolfebacteria bacterium]